MSDDFDIEDGQGKRPTKEQAVAVHGWLKSRNRSHSLADVLVELTARGFKSARSSVGRHLAGLNEAEGKSPTQRAESRNTERRKVLRKPERQNGPVSEAIKAMKADPEVVKMATLMADTNTSTQLAIWENRRRMALNIIIAETMAASPNLLMSDMRGTAALVDALTVAAKLSGGAAIDISKGADAPGEMKDITPMKTLPQGLVDDFEQFKARMRNGNGKGT